MHKIKLVSILSILLIFFNSLVLAYDISDLQESSRGVQFQINHSGQVRLIKEAMADSVFNIVVKGALYHQENNLNIPFWGLKIALPSPNYPEISITNIVYQPTDIKITDNDQIAALESLNLYKIGDLGYAGLVPAMILDIAPIRLNPQSNQLEVIKTATITISYKNSYKGVVNVHEQADFSFVNANSSQYFIRKPGQLKKITKPQYPSGKWYRVTISDAGNYEFNNENPRDNIFKITYEDLKTAGLTDGEIAADRIFMYANPTFGRNITDYQAEPLVEIPRNISNDAATFKTGEFLYFYGKSPSGLYIDHTNKLKFQRNPYSFENFFWILIADNAGNPRSIEKAAKSNSTPEYTITKTDYLSRKGKENYNVLDSGNDWYNKIFAERGATATEVFYLPPADNDYSADISFSLKSGSSDNVGRQYYKIYLNNALINETSTFDYSKVTGSMTGSLRPHNNTFRVEFYYGNGTGYLDYIQCEYEISLDNFTDNIKFIAPPESGTIKYQLTENYPDSPRIFDVTDPLNIREIQIDHAADNVSFTDDNPAGARKSYLMVSETNYSEPDDIHEFSSPDFNSLYDFKNAQYVIITDESLLPAAEKIAHIHSSRVRDEDQLSTFVTTQSQIFRQFNADVQDPAAIRNFLKYAYDNWEVKPKYVLLLGDGSYDHRKIKTDTKNHVMTYQNYYYSWGYYYYATDFFYTFLSESDNIPDVAIGRIPASDLEEANNYVEKLEDYIINPEFGSWRNTFSLVADDPARPNKDEPVFISDSELLANSVLPNLFDIKKLYLTEYPASQDESQYGVKKPAATEAILKQLETGSSVINFIGHGGPGQWTQENAFSDADLPRIENSGKLTLWIAGTCTWGKFDDVASDCMPEKLIGMQGDGAIAAIGATRPTTNNGNFALFSSIFKFWFQNNEVRRIRIGDLMKNFIRGGSVNQKYELFGDPALFPALPYQSANFAKLPNDTLQALQNVQVTGETEIENFSGKAIVTLFDSQQEVTRYYTPMYSNEQVPITYKLPGDALFKGNVNVIDGNFQSSFYIPKDLNYSNDFGKIHIYGWNEDNEFAGTYNDIIFTGSENVSDSTGPEIRILKNNEDFFDGGLINTGDQVALKITDEHGINLAGKMGHNISLQIDDNAETLDLTADFAYEENSDTSGLVNVELPEDLEPGEHYITAKAWDNANNANSLNLSFNYSQSEKFKISKIVNYPNPFKNETDITFYSSEPCEFDIVIYAVNGLKIKEFKNLQSSIDGFNRIFWNGEDDFGDTVARGTYLYKINAKSLSSQKKDSYIGKMVKS